MKSLVVVFFYALPNANAYLLKCEWYVICNNGMHAAFENCSLLFLAFAKINRKSSIAFGEAYVIETICCLLIFF